MKKTIQDWFQSVTDLNLKNKLLTNLDRQWSSKEVASLDEAIHSAFYWSSSSEGYEYWDNLTAYKFSK